MAAADEFFAHSPGSGPSPHSKKHGQSQLAQSKLERQTQLDFDLAFFAGVLQRAPDYIDVLRCQGESLTRKGLHPQALAIDRRLAELLPGDCVVQYNLACSLTMTGQRGEAMAALRCALEAGYDDFDYLRADSDLDGLRDEPAYHALLQEFQPKD